MTPIINLPDEPKFTIKVVANQVGVRPVTLRAWERRHDVLAPHRADNHYRLYSERDVAILRWLKYRVDEGISIGSAVSELHNMSKNSMWPEAIPTAPTPAPVVSDSSPAYFANRLSQALIKHDESRASNLLREAHASFDLMTVFMEVLVPSIEKLGEAWYRGEIPATTERFADAYLRSKLLSLLQAYPSRHSAPLVFLGSAPMEVHELYSLMMAVLLRSQGYRVEYLGPDINIEDLADYAVYEQPSLVILWAMSEFTAREMRRTQEMLKMVRSKPTFAFSGQAFDLQPTLQKVIPGVYLGGTLETAMESIKGLLRSRQKTTARTAAVH